MLLVLLFALVPRPAFADEPVGAKPVGAKPVGAKPPISKARELHNKGIALIRQEKMYEACAALDQAYDLVPSYATAGALTICELELKRYRFAAEHASQYLREAPAGSSVDERKVATEALDEAKKHIGTLTITVDHDGADISVDGELIGQSPFDRSVFVDPGKHTVSAKKIGAGAKSIELHLIAAERRTVDLTLEARDEESAAGYPYWPLYMIGGVAIAGVAVGVATIVAADSAASDADAIADELRADSPVACHETTRNASRCAELLSLREDHDTLQGAAVISFAVGATALAGGVIYYFTAIHDGSSDAQASGSSALPVIAVPWLTPDGAGVGFTGHF